MVAETDEVIDALDAAVSPLLRALGQLSYISRHMRPPRLAALLEEAGEMSTSVQLGIDALESVDWPNELKSIAAQLTLAASQTCEAFDQLLDAGHDPNGLMQAYYALRHATRAQASLYPLAAMLPAVNRFFLDDTALKNESLVARLAAGAGRENTGVMHSTSASGDTRGGFSLYVPETYDAARAHPLIFSLHGGSGHGRLCLWSWLRAARSRGAILVSPSSRGSTWALQGPDIDTPNLVSMLDYVRGRWNVDEKHMLMTGMSDGGTFTYISGLQAGQPFTHLAPVAASFHPMMLEFFDADRIKNLPIHITHGALDWMFPAVSGRNMALSLEAFGAKVIYREIADLSHTYPDASENAQVMDWFLGLDPIRMNHPDQ